MKKVTLESLPTSTTSHNAGRKKVMITKGEIPALIQFAQVAFASGETAPGHKHVDMYEVFFVESGEGVFTINGKIQTIQKGTCITIEPGELHELTNTGEIDLVLTYFGIKDAK